MAPELIPVTVTPGNIATQKGDVYSFAIILEEIIIRGGPYEVARQYMTAQEVPITIYFFYIISNILYINFQLCKIKYFHFISFYL